jgi:hypothetical protein
MDTELAVKASFRLVGKFILFKRAGNIRNSIGGYFRNTPERSGMIRGINEEIPEHSGCFRSTSGILSSSLPELLENKPRSGKFNTLYTAYL